MKRKFDITYMIAKENMSFTKMKAMCALEERHGVDLGEGYKNDRGCSDFVEFTARDQQERLVAELTHSKFFSLQADGSTDAGNIKDELFLVLYLDYHSTKGKVCIVNSFFTVRQLESGTGQGLFDCLRNAVEYIGVTGWEDKLIVFGCDCANANMGERSGLNGHFKEAVPWGGNWLVLGSPPRVVGCPQNIFLYCN